jgi:hypothetical protein
MLQINVTVLYAVWWVHGAWENVTPETMKKCFRHSGFVVSSTGEEDNLDDEIYCLPEEYESQLPNIRNVAMFGNILEVHYVAAGNVDNVVDKVMISSEFDCEEASSEEEVETSVCEEPPTHQRAIHCIQELERYAFAFTSQNLLKLYSDCDVKLKGNGQILR